MTIIVNLIVFAALLLLVWKSSKTGENTSRKIFLGLCVGVLYGVSLQVFYGIGTEALTGTLEWTDIIATGYLNLLKMITIPVIFVTMIAGVFRLKNISSLGKISGLILGILFTTAIISSAVAVGTASIFDLSAVGLNMGDREIATGTYFTSRIVEVSNVTVPSLITDYIPRNIFSDFTAARPLAVLAVIVFSIILGAAIRKAKDENPDSSLTITSIIDVSETIVMSLLKMIMIVSPFGVMALMTKLAATLSAADILYFGKYIIAVYVAIAIMFVIHAGLLNFFGFSPRKYFKAVFPVLVIGGATSSASSCVPLNIETQINKLGISKAIAVISATFGATNGQNACGNIFPAILAIMIAPLAGITVDFNFMMTLIVVVAVSSFGIASFGGGWPNAVLVVFPIMGLPVEMAGILIAVDPLIDKARTALNINGAIVAGTITNQILNKNETIAISQPAE